MDYPGRVRTAQCSTSGTAGERPWRRSVPRNPPAVACMVRCCLSVEITLAGHSYKLGSDCLRTTRAVWTTA